MATVINTLGLEMPVDFPTDAYNGIHTKICSEQRSPTPFRECMGALNTVVFRFMACADHDLAFTESVQRASVAPPAIERYGQEKELFNFFVNGLSALESFCYGLFAIASMMDSTNFPMQKVTKTNFVPFWFFPRTVG